MDPRWSLVSRRRQAVRGAEFTFGEWQGLARAAEVTACDAGSGPAVLRSLCDSWGFDSSVQTMSLASSIKETRLQAARRS